VQFAVEHRTVVAADHVAVPAKPTNDAFLSVLMKSDRDLPRQARDTHDEIWGNREAVSLSPALRLNACVDLRGHARKLSTHPRVEALPILFATQHDSAFDSNSNATKSN
jgi:hypothetical protein